MNRRRLTSCSSTPSSLRDPLLVRPTAHSTVANTFKMRRQHVQRSQSTSCPDPGINLVPLERQCNRHGDSQPVAAASAARLDIKRSPTVPCWSPVPTSPPSPGNSVWVCMVAKGSRGKITRRSRSSWRVLLGGYVGVAPAPVAIETSFSQATKKSIIDQFADLMLRLRTLNPWAVLALFKLSVSHYSRWLELIYIFR